MSVLEIKQLTHRYDERYLFDKADLVINNGEHVGIVGLNGAGKSTFINIIAGRISHDEGEVKWLSGIRQGYLDQHALIDGSLTVMEYLQTAFNHLHEKNLRLEKLYEKMGDATPDELDVLISKSSRLQEELEKEHYFELDSQIKKVANGLGVNKFGYETKISTLSGGERAKLMLSKLLLEEQDVMLLDEPTNFLDIEHIDWLIKYLNGYKKTFIVISHDVEFLDSVCKFIVNIENGEIRKYTGNYTEFLSQREMYAKQHEDAYKRQQAEIKRLTDYIDRNKARAATAKMAQSRQKMLDKLEIVSKPVEAYEAEFNFPYVDINAKEFVVIDNLEVGYSSTLIPPISLTLNSTDKLWIRGTNGVGKTTLLKTLMRKIPAINGRFSIHLGAKILYLEQELNFKNPSNSALEYYQSNCPRDNIKQARQALAKVGLVGELATKPISKTSGGEQVRAKLAVLTKQSSNLLVLDEPTNHLDVLAKASLLKALQEYNGAIILVSHEKDFAEKLCNKVFDARAK